MKSARRTALDFLLKIERQNAYAAPLLAKAVPGFGAKDRRLLVELVYGVLRWRRSLDWIIEKVSRYPLSRMDATILNLLRLGAYQSVFLSRIPPHAIVFSSVNMAKSLRGEKAGGFVNAVSRRISEWGKAALELLPQEASRDALAIRSSHPTWLVKRWIVRFGLKETEALCRANNEPPPATLRVNTLATTRERVLESAGRDSRFQEVGLEPTKTARNGLAIVPLSAVFEADWLERGWVTIQDEASQLVGEIVDPRPGERILDACAGIGTKATQLMELAGGSPFLLCTDVIPWKLGQIAAATRRLGLSVPFRVAASMGTPPLANRPIFDKVLVDAPCTNTGVIRRHPERKWRLTEKDIKIMARIQKGILASAAPLVRRGGALIYSTCSLEREEGEEIVEDFMKRHPKFAIEDCSRFLPERAKPHIQNGMFRSFPHKGKMDGFFCARLRKEK